MKSLAIILAFFAGFLFCVTYRHRDLVEGFEGEKKEVQEKKQGSKKEKKEGKVTNNCPNLLVKKGQYIYLLHKDKAIIPGVNPIRFENLEQYAEFLQYQRRMGVVCPVLFFEESFDAQNNKVWRAAKDPFDPLAGNPPNDSMRGAGDTVVGKLLDANFDNNPPHNKGMYPAYDPYNQNLGRWTPLDKMFHARGISLNPMDTNWRARGFPPTRRNSLKLKKGGSVGGGVTTKEKKDK
tara:strand:+ start:280 stop:987 length:708 start_codon:yes stop_codon:yes gene_type:complete